MGAHAMLQTMICAGASTAQNNRSIPALRNLSPAWRREGSGDLISVDKYLVVGLKMMRPGSSQGRRQWAQMGIQEIPRRHRKVFIVRMVKHRNRLPREVEESPSLEILKSQLDTALSNLLSLTLLQAGPWTRRSSAGWRLNHFPGQPVSMLDNPFSEVKFPNIQSKPPLAQLEAISSHPITCYLGEETDPHLSTTSFQAKQSQLPQPLLIRLVLQTLHQLRCPSLDTLQHLNVPLVVRGPKLNTVFEVRPHQCRVQGHDHFPSPAGHAISDTSQDATGFLGHLVHIGGVSSRRKGSDLKLGLLDDESYLADKGSRQEKAHLPWPQHIVPVREVGREGDVPGVFKERKGRTSE
ncbi:hypothetical protein QYF61_001785 [Mycteria americana]|uniref:Uncharacterized protein n=1 Tax=Mycteria americana TaxID=33587 RepID=A0AAN7S960_MYCAM|nr:hypothetical protein QYF61_001785 [Mycteria americana]